MLSVRLRMVVPKSSGMIRFLRCLCSSKIKKKKISLFLFIKERLYYLAKNNARYFVRISFTKTGTFYEDKFL